MSSLLPVRMLTRITVGVNKMVDPRRRRGSTSLLWGFKSVGGLAH
jgi:hypothetical protein